ncbi:hypothetical protein CDAR_39711 [Caerostris darwini]|uniref:Uncharacterized protein n=1 Tax=Caerostris darwini TaxID=1538125 RepID=A0AAV4U6I8_9ARAC|nr:hypothetical protein CDAR_39711 [Caerostris darwini]
MSCPEILGHIRKLLHPIFFKGWGKLQKIASLFRPFRPFFMIHGHSAIKNASELPTFDIGSFLHSVSLNGDAAGTAPEMGHENQYVGQSPLSLGGFTSQHKKICIGCSVKSH